MDVDARVEAWACLQLLPGVGPRSLHLLLKALGSPEAIRDASRASLAKLIPDRVAALVAAGPDPELLARTLDWLAAPNHHLVAWDDADYPQQLLQTSDPPPVFYFVGRRELLSRRCIAVVGSRNATPQGVANAEAFAGALSAAGLTIVSGLALGIDAAAHRGGLTAAGGSLGVVGTGLDRVYPARNLELAHRLAEEGGILSEFALGTPPMAGNFPRRNRVISGLAQACLVIEATLASGSLITARLAAEQGRDVMAIPGSIHSPFSKGCHRLIKDGAKLVESAEDILVELGITREQGRKDSPSKVTSSSSYDTLLSAMGADPIAMDTLCERMGTPVEQLASALLELELSGQVATLPGGRFQRVF